MHPEQHCRLSGEVASKWRAFKESFNSKVSRQGRSRRPFLLLRPRVNRTGSEPQSDRPGVPPGPDWVEGEPKLIRVSRNLKNSSTPYPARNAVAKGEIEIP